MTSDQFGAFVPFILIAAGIYFLLIRPARRRAQAVDKLQRSLAVGTEVMLTSGVYGQVRDVVDDRVLVEVAPGVVLTVHRGAIGKVVTPVPADDEQEPSYEDIDDGSEVDPNPATDDTDPDSRGAH